ncbi:hypothetical protein [Burkholderia glumae]|uniref:Lipoprotein n=1 Tax=Burkholderia glumae TaxID=337 RepID=A0AAP9Y1C6_BURGL|nr:hypothetical protein [Burkholderia glumae]ACR30254.1 Hypothetical protein bglu_1g31910 [Burkholderia glumae BGR1]KHJ64925.1 hypothetical protein NCPPB3923_00495 [Burkholderia glumae]MCM2482100.1 hypothetical protein [Burkholderia glumae]MCM2507757.1 hypothetical protein [Burkholderia glumae]MCM2536263.1 hypothetical protein [Burkholderia glumae]
MSIPDFRAPAAARRFPRGAAALLARARACLLLAVAAAAAVGCSPALDWRTLHSDAGYTIDLPARPTVDARTVEIGGAPLTMRMQAAHVAGAVFAVGTVTLPQPSEAGRRAVLEALRAALARNLRAQPVVREVAVPLAAGGSTPGVELTIRGGPAGSSQATAGKTMVARLVARGAHVYQAVAIADTPLPAEALDQFLGSLKLD